MRRFIGGNPWYASRVPADEAIDTFLRVERTDDGGETWQMVHTDADFETK